MKYGFICLLLLSFTFGSCHFFHGERIKGNGNIVTENRDVSTFKEIEVSSAIDVQLSPGESPSVKVEIDQNVQPYIEVYTKGSVLYIHQKNNTSLNTSKRVKVYVTAVALSRLEVSGACNLSVTDTIRSNGQLDISISGASEAEMMIKAETLSLGMDGASKANLEGNVKDMRVDANGSCDLKAFGLSADNVDVKLEGASSVQVYPTVKLLADANGASKIYYKGNVTPAYTLNGASSISKVD
ncbi:MAG TPA: head GIN domain-containing protein [Chitinophagaceae bacterium]|jgi:hypothetical protein|nr:head GIN domain-containing protein [Chitinophagaceae bacterium]